MNQEVLFLLDLPDGLIEGIAVIGLAGFSAGFLLFFSGFAFRSIWASFKKFSV